MKLTEEEVRLIKILRMVKSNERSYLTIENRDDQMNLTHQFTDTFDFVSDDIQKESIRFVDYLRQYYPNLIINLKEFSNESLIDFNMIINHNGKR